MAVIGVILVVLFVIICVFLVGLVLLQNGEGEGLGGLFAGGSNSAFGSRSASVLTKVTYVCVGMFFVIAFFLALMNKTPSDRGFQQEVQIQRATEARESWWTEDAGAGAVLEEAGEDTDDSGFAGQKEADAVMTNDSEVTLPEQPGDALQDAEIDTLEETGGALRPD